MDIKKRIEELQAQLKRHRRTSLKELPTRTIFIDPLLDTLGWNVRDPDEVELEYPTIDSKAVDFALKIGRKPVILLEAKALDDPLDDVKAITQVVGYATNDGIDWCVLTNGIRYKVYRSSEKVPAPDKLLFEVSIDPENNLDLSIDQMASHLSRLSKASMADGVLDELGEEIFTTAKIRKALDRLFGEQDDSLLRVIRRSLGDDNISLAQIRKALSRIWRVETPTKPARSLEYAEKAGRRRKSASQDRLDYGEAHHTDGKPVEVVESYRALDRYCQDRAPGRVVRRHLAKHIAWSLGKSVFCSVHLLHSGLKMWLKVSPGSIPASVTFARDVSKVGHWGSGDVEFAIDSLARLREAEPYIQASFDQVVDSAA
ncbi:MAG: type I restriction enzyme HsdR N-terminal domain-containing protein [Anaerolineales bacterium]|nr:type I restriction enzyme HsdR N-terminal domain-containing protein [Anaerolineales bacterium]